MRKRKMSAEQRAAVSAHMKAYWAKRRASGNMTLPRKKKTVRQLAASAPVRKLANSVVNRYAILGATIRLREVEAERDQLKKFLKRA